MNPVNKSDFGQDEEFENGGVHKDQKGPLDPIDPGVYALDQRRIEISEGKGGIEGDPGKGNPQSPGKGTNNWFSRTLFGSARALSWYILIGGVLCLGVFASRYKSHSMFNHPIPQVLVDSQDCADPRATVELLRAEVRSEVRSEVRTAVAEALASITVDKVGPTLGTPPTPPTPFTGGAKGVKARSWSSFFHGEVELTLIDISPLDSLIDYLTSTGICQIALRQLQAGQEGVVPAATADSAAFSERRRRFYRCVAHDMNQQRFRYLPTRPINVGQPLTLANLPRNIQDQDISTVSHFREIGEVMDRARSWKGALLAMAKGAFRVRVRVTWRPRF